MELIVLIIFAVIVVVVVMSLRKSGAGSNTGSTTGSSTASTGGASKSKIAEDIRMTKTSRIVDEVSILDELNATSEGFRQYCELVGKSQESGGVTAPYSQREVAYYNVRCYRVEMVDGRESETLVAHENSIEPFYFTDDSCETPVYIDLSTFGGNIILVNSSNHIEGPTSDFSKAFQKNSSSSVTAFAARAIERASNWASNVRPRTGFAAAPALAVAGAGVAGNAGVVVERREWKFMAPPGGGPGGPGGFGGPGGGPHGGFGGPGGGPHGGFGAPGLGGFLGGGHMGGAPHGGGGSGAEALVGIGLGALIGAVAASQNTQTSTGGSQSHFRGYRLVEDVVPLSSPVYCIGEIYKTGDEVHMGKSLAKDYPTSFFACKHESELLSALGK